MINEATVYNTRTVYDKTGGVGIDLSNVCIFTDAANGVNFGTKEIVSYLTKSGFHIYNSDYSVYPAPQHKQGFEFVCKINNYSNSQDYAIFAAGAPTNQKGVSFQIEHGFMWIGLPGSGAWIDAANIDVRNILEPDKYFKFYGMCDLDTGRVVFSIDDVVLFDDIINFDKNNFGTSQWFNVFSNSVDYAPRVVAGSIKINTIKIINDTNIFS